MTERHPIDKYSKDSYQEGLDLLSETEERINVHPLQEDMAIHRELRKESAGPYPFAGEEENVRIAFEAETVDIRREADAIKQDLWRQLSNAQTEAMKMNEELGSRELAREVLPEITKIEENTIQRMGIPNINKDLPNNARAHGWAVLNFARDAKSQIASEKSVLNIQKIFTMIKTLYREFVSMAGNVVQQDRFGHPA